MSAANFFARHHFLFRRLHSLTGIVPVGVFLIVHLFTNSSIVWGGFNSRAEGETFSARSVVTFRDEVHWINSLPLLLVVEISLWSALAFHAVLGIYYAQTGKSNATRYPYQDNWRYTLQRITGYIAFLFIFYHVATLRWGWSWLVPGQTVWEHTRASSTLAAAIRGSASGEFAPGGIVVSIAYFVGITASVFHFANGLWTAAITWGLTISQAAQRRWGYICASLGVMLMLMGWGALVGFAILNPRTAERYELALPDPAPRSEPLAEPFEPPAAPLEGG